MNAKLTKLDPSDGILRSGVFRTLGFATAEAANEFMQGNPEWGMLAEKDGEILLAKLTDTGDGKNSAPRLKAGTQTGSLINHLMSGGVSATPKIGDGATILSWTDRRAATITEISPSGKRIGIVEDIATRTDNNGMSDMQTYDYAPGSGSPSYFTLRKNGAWVREGESMKGGQRLTIGTRRHYYDFSF